MTHPSRLLVAPVLLAVASCAQQVPRPWSTTAEPSPRIVAAICAGPTRAVRVLRNAGGEVGGYVAVPSIMDSPIAYQDATGKSLAVFHIFDSDAAKAAASATIARLTAAFPREEIVPCTAPPR